MKVKEIPQRPAIKEAHSTAAQPQVISELPFGKMQARLPIVIDHREQGRAIMAANLKEVQPRQRMERLGWAWEGCDRTQQGDNDRTGEAATEGQT